MSDRIKEIAMIYAANAGEVDKLAAAIADLVRDEREECAKVADAFRADGVCICEQCQQFMLIAQSIRERKP